MALSLDAISFIQALSISTATSTTLGASQLTRTRLTRIESTQSTLSTKLNDLETLDKLLKDLISATSSLRPSPTKFGSSIDVIGSNSTAETIDLDATTSASLQTGDKVTFDTAFGNVAANTPYWVNRGTTTGANTTFTLYTTRSGALAGGATDRVDITTNGNQSSFAKQIIPQPETGIENFFTGFNAIQDFLAEKLASSGSLADETQLKLLSATLSKAVVPLLKDANLGPALTTSSSDNTIKVDTGSLQSRISATPQAIASLFEDTTSGGSGFAKSVQDIAAVFQGPTGVIGEIKNVLELQSTDLDTRLSALTEKAEEEQATTRKELALIAKSTAAVSLQISFLSKLAS